MSSYRISLLPWCFSYLWIMLETRHCNSKCLKTKYTRLKEWWMQWTKSLFIRKCSNRNQMNLLSRRMNLSTKTLRKIRLSFLDLLIAYMWKMWDSKTQKLAKTNLEFIFRNQVNRHKRMSHLQKENQDRFRNKKAWLRKTLKQVP